MLTQSCKALLAGALLAAGASAAQAGGWCPPASGAGASHARVVRSAIRIVRPHAPRARLVARFGGSGAERFYGSTGFGYGSTGYGYGGDFSGAYTSGYDDFQGIGYGDAAGTYGGQPYGRPAFSEQAGYGYGGLHGWAPALPPAGGLAVYSPGAYGPGPRIITIPSQYRAGAETIR